MRYELMVILNPSLEKKALDSLVTEMKEDLSENSIQIISEDNWGVRDLAYKIHGSGTGYYMVWTLETSDASRISQVNTMFNIKKDIWRYMFTLMVNANK